MSSEKDEEKEPLSVETKKLKPVAHYSLDLTLNKDALREIHNRDPQGKLKSFKEWAKQKWRISTFRTEKGFMVEFEKAA